jgi:V/A-type H+-transporting ATPase subunit D
VPRIPPGRAGRVWVGSRLQTARRGADLLDRKVRILTRLEADLRSVADQTQADWERCCQDTQEWSLRAALLGGRRAIRLAAATRVAHVDVTWTTTMGVDVPTAAVCEIYTRDGDETGPVSAAVTTAAAVHGRALQAAARHAAAAAALRRVTREIALTRRRLRAIERRWIPRLEAALSDLEAALEQQEREDSVRLRRAMGSDPAANPSGSE